MRGQSMRYMTALLPLALALALAPVNAAAADDAGKVIGHGVRLKGSKIWVAQGNATRPRAISARIVPIPAQPVEVHWAVVCQRPDPHDPAYKLSATNKSGEASVRAAATVQLALPYARPHTCVATVYATLKKNGSVTLRLLQT